MLKNKNGVTLVGLVVTIIVLLIITGTTIGEAIGDHGIITMALKAAGLYAEDQEAERYALEVEVYPTSVYVKLYENGTLVFSKYNIAESGYGNYEDFGDIANEVYSLENLPPWLIKKVDFSTGGTFIDSNVENVEIEQGLVPTNMSFWFAYLSKITVFQLVNIDVTKTISTQGLFYNCTNAEIIYVRHPSWNSLNDTNLMFEGCKAKELTFFSYRNESN